MRAAVFVLTAGLLVLTVAPAARTDAASPAAPSARSTRVPPQVATSAEHVRLAELPCDFEANLGQTAPEVDYVARCRGYVAFLTRGDAVIRSAADALRIRVSGARAAAPAASQERPGRSHHFIGSDPSKGVTNVPRFGEVAYRGVLPGVDLVWRTARREAAFDVHVAADADAAAVRFTVDGATWLGPDASGALSIGLPSGATAKLSAPVAWQVDGATRLPVDVAFAQGSSPCEFGFDVGARVAGLPLVIDPGLSMGSYVGGTMNETFTSLRTDAAGSVYVTGSTASLDYPVVAGSFQTTKGELNTINTDGYVTKFDPTGTSHVWSTYLGGQNNDSVFDAAITAAGDVCVAGSTGSFNFPRLNAYQTTFSSAFVTKIAASGASLVWSTYFQYGGQKLGLDASENVHGYSTSASRKFAFSANGQTLLQSFSVNAFSPPTFTWTSMAVLPSGETWLGGGLTNNQTNLSMPGAFQGFHGGAADGWLVRVSTAGTILYSSYVGLGGDDRITGLATDAAGNLYVCGWTSGLFPTVNAAQDQKASGQSGFVMKLDPTGATAHFSTYFGGASDLTLNCITTSAAGHVFVGGSVVGVGMPIQDAYQPTFAGGSNDAVIAEYDAQGALVRSTFLGGTVTESATAIAVGATGRPVVGGLTQSADFPNACGVQTALRANDAFIASVTTGPAFALSPSDQTLASGTVGRPYSRPLAVSGGTAPVTFTLQSGTLPAGLSLTAAGVLSGTPTATANTVLNVKVRDADGQCIVRPFSVVVNAAPSVPTATLAPWTTTRVYQATLPRNDGTAPYTWDVASGNVPPGLSLTAAGALDGTPTAQGTFKFTARVTDVNGSVAQGEMTVKVNAVPTVTTPTLDEWTTGRPWSQPIGLADGTPPFVWSISAGSLPPGSAIDPGTGTLGAAALAAGVSSFTVRALDAAGAEVTKAYTLRVNPAPLFVTESLPLAAADRPYAVQIDTTGGTRPFAWTLQTGSFGDGFAGVDQEGRVVGVPTGAGTATATVRVADAAGAFADRALSVTVAPGVDLAAGKSTLDVVVTPETSGRDVIRYVELLAGTTLDLKAKVSHANQFAIDLLLLDADEAPIDLGSFKKSKAPTVSVRKFPILQTGRYFIVLRQATGFSGNVKLDIGATAQAKKSGTGRVEPDVSSVAVRFAVQPGSQVKLTATTAKKSAAVPVIVSLTDAAGAELLQPGDVTPSKKGSTLAISRPLDGGDYVAVLAANGGAAGDVNWALSVKAPKGYRFSLPDLAVGGE